MTVANVKPIYAKSTENLKQLADLDITVLAGGPGVEREVSLDSGKSVTAALNRLGHRAVMMDIGPDDLAALDRPADFVFIVLHGEFGEDGTVQALLDKRGIRYSGSRQLASRRAMNKVESKQAFERAGILTPEYEVLDAARVSTWVPKLTPPTIIKPVCSGSSVDMVITHTEQELQDSAVGVATKYGQALIERYIRGPELTVSVLGTQALPVCQIVPKREFYDYHAKYIDDDTEYLFEIDLPQAVLEQVQEDSVVAHHSLGCSVFSRVDWMVEKDTLRPYVLEVNTIPGFTSHSLFPKAASRIGMNFDQFCQRIIELSWSEGD